MPWLNRFDPEWLSSEIAPRDHVFVLEDHAPVGGLGDALRRRSSTAAPVDRASASRAGPRAERLPRRSASTGSTARSLAERVAAALGARSP